MEYVKGTQEPIEDVPHRSQAPVQFLKVELRWRYIVMNLLENQNLHGSEFLLRHCVNNVGNPPARFLLTHCWAFRAEIPNLFDAPRPSDLPLRLCLLYTSPSPRDVEESRMPSSA